MISREGDGVCPIWQWRARQKQFPKASVEGNRIGLLPAAAFAIPIVFSNVYKLVRLGHGLRWVITHGDTVTGQERRSEWALQ